MHLSVARGAGPSLKHADSNLAVLVPWLTEGACPGKAMETLEVPSPVLQLWGRVAFTGATLEINAVKQEIRILWGIKSGAKGGSSTWCSQLARVKTRLARLQLDHRCKPVAAAVLRSCGASFRARTLMSWRPHLVVVLGILGESFSAIEKLDPRFVRRTWPVAAGIALRLLVKLDGQCGEDGDEQQDPEVSGTDPDGEEESQDGSTSSSSSSSSSSDCSKSPSQPESQAEMGSQASASAPAGSSRSAPEPPAPAPVEERGFPSAPAGAASAARGGGAPGVRAASAAPPIGWQPSSPGLPVLGGDEDVARDARREEAEREMRRILAARRKSPLNILGLRRGASAADRRKAYYRLARLIHPDKLDLAGAPEAFQILGNAYEKVRV